MNRRGERVLLPGDTEVLAVRPSRREAWWSVLATIAAVIVVHGVDLRYRLVFDDYYWLKKPPSGLREILRTLLPTTTGAGVYRPFLALWFGAMKAVFGIDPLPYHVFALAAIVAAALAVRWLSLQLGLRNLPATISGIVVGTHGALAITTMWASCTQSSMMITFAAVAIATVVRPGPPGWRRQLLAALFLVAAIVCRDSAVVTPVLATILLLARPGAQIRLTSALQSTAGLWVVAVAYGSIRVVNGVFHTAANDPYRVSMGPHVVSNTTVLMKYAAHFGVPRSSGTLELIAMTGIFIAFWLVLVGGAVWASIRHDYLPAAGLACFFVGIIPFVGLTAHGIETYYIEVGVIGLAVAIGALLDATSVRSWALVALTVMFVLVQVVAVQFVHSRHWIQTSIARTDVLEDYARRTPIHNGVLVVKEACASDRAVTRDGALFQLLLDKPDLRVRFEVLDPGTLPTTRWGCREGP
jgi:hypothetical protein